MLSYLILCWVSTHLNEITVQMTKMHLFIQMNYKAYLGLRLKGHSRHLRVFIMTVLSKKVLSHPSLIL